MKNLKQRAKSNKPNIRYKTPDSTKENDINALKTTVIKKRGPSKPIPLKEITYICKQTTLQSLLKFTYGSDIEMTLRQHDQELPNPLPGHEVSSELRAKLIDWIIEILHTLKCSRKTLYLAVKILDCYLAKEKHCVEASQVHLLGITTMFIASKYEDIRPLKARLLSEKISHKQISVKEICAMERHILTVLDFSIPDVTLIDFLEKLLCDEEVSEVVRYMSLILGEITLMDIELANLKPSQLSAAIILLTYEALGLVSADLAQGSHVYRRLKRYLQEYPFSHYVSVNQKYNIQLMV